MWNNEALNLWVKKELENHEIDTEGLILTLTTQNNIDLLIGKKISKYIGYEKSVVVIDLVPEYYFTLPRFDSYVVKGGVLGFVNSLRDYSLNEQPYFSHVVPFHKDLAIKDIAVNFASDATLISYEPNLTIKYIEGYSIFNFEVYRDDRDKKHSDVLALLWYGTMMESEQTTKEEKK